MGKRKEFIKLYRKAAMLYVRLNSYAHKFFYAKGFRPYDEIHPIDFVITPTAMTLDVGGVPTDVLNIVDDKIAIVNKYGDFTLTLKATIPAEIEWEIITWKFQKQVAGELIDCDDTDVTFAVNPADETEAIFSITTVDREACSIIATAEIEGDFGVIGNGIPIETEFFDIPIEFAAAPTAMTLDVQGVPTDVLNFANDEISIVNLFGDFDLTMKATIPQTTPYTTITWGFTKEVAGQLVDCDDTAVTFTPNSLDETECTFDISTIQDEACTLKIQAVIEDSLGIVGRSKMISVKFSDVPKLTIAPTALMFGGDDILDYDAETKTITVLDKLGVFTLDLEMTPLQGVDFDTLDWSYAKVVEGELANCDDTTVTFTKDSVEPLKKVAFTITTIANVACSVVIDATISKDSTIIETSHSIKIEFKETPATPPEPEP